MELRHRQRISLAIWLGSNLLAVLIGPILTAPLADRVWGFLYEKLAPEQITAGLSFFPSSTELQFFFALGFAVVGIVVGALFGLVQWLTLRRLLTLPPWWIWINALWWASGLVISYTFFANQHITVNEFRESPFSITFLGGAISIVGEWFVIRSYLRQLDG